MDDKDKIKLIKSIQDEIEKDPEKLGYKGKTTQQIMDLINSPVIKEEQIIAQPEPPEEVKPNPGDVIGVKREVKDARILHVIGGITGAPNAITKELIEEALKDKKG